MYEIMTNVRKVIGFVKKMWTLDYKIKTWKCPFSKITLLWSENPNKYCILIQYIDDTYKLYQFY